MDIFDDPFVHWFNALERRHLTNLSFSEVRKGIQALSSLYVERRGGIDRGHVFSGAGKRAAFAMYFGPLHFLLVREIVRALDARLPQRTSILDLGCGTGAAGAAWALAFEARPQLIGVDRNSWALQECRWTYQQLGVQGKAKAADLDTLRIPANTAVIAAFTINELDLHLREHFRREFTRHAEDGAPVLIVEPIARRLTSWWDEWSQEWGARGGRADEWRFPIELPDRLKLMDKASGLSHRELTGRSLWLPPPT
jgi:SAM-dependent methyltransferase